MTHLSVAVRNSITLQSISPNSPLKKILSSSLRDLNLHQRMSSDPETPYWGADFFCLTKVPAFLALSEERRHEVLLRCSQNLITEITFLEKAATCFTAKMTLLAERSEERMLYTLIGGEEVAHHTAMLTYLVQSRLPSAVPPFISLVNRVLEEADRLPLIFFVQVVLEGWGISHFSSLAQWCLADDLKATLEWFVRHEARHHGSGVVLYSEARPSASDLDYLINALASFLDLIRLGPQAVLGHLAAVHGDMSGPDIRSTYHSLQAEESTLRKLNHLKKLMLSAGGAKIVNELESRRCFEPFPPDVCISMVLR